MFDEKHFGMIGAVLRSKLARQRWGLVSRRQLRWQDIALRQRPWQGRAQQVSHAFQNQFEIPVLFYVLVGLVRVTKKAELFFVVMEWLFVATRIARAHVHTTSNYVLLRGQFFIVGAIVLFLMWRLFAVRTLNQPPDWSAMIARSQ